MGKGMVSTQPNSKDKGLQNTPPMLIQVRPSQCSLRGVGWGGGVCDDMMSQRKGGGVPVLIFSTTRQLTPP